MQVARWTTQNAFMWSIMFSPKADRATNILIEEDANVHLVMKEKEENTNEVTRFKTAMGKGKDSHL